MQDWQPAHELIHLIYGTTMSDKLKIIIKETFLLFWLVDYRGRSYLISCVVSQNRPYTCNRLNLGTSFCTFKVDLIYIYIS